MIMKYDINMQVKNTLKCALKCLMMVMVMFNVCAADELQSSEEVINENIHDNDEGDVEDEEAEGDVEDESAEEDEDESDE